jgi:hypothetical protein
MHQTPQAIHFLLPTPPSPETLNYSDRESPSPSPHELIESHHSLGGAGEEAFDCTGGGSMELQTRSEAGASQPSASGGFPFDFAMQPDVEGNFTVDVNNKFWIENEWDEDFSDVDGMGGGGEEEAPRKDKDWEIGQQSDVSLLLLLLLLMVIIELHHRSDFLMNT